MERVVEGVDLDRASRTVVVGDRSSWLLSAALVPWCVARVDSMLAEFPGQAGMSPAQQGRKITRGPGASRGQAGDWVICWRFVLCSSVVVR